MPEPIGPTRVVTFYSYKGGVGRTMALVNTAHVLALQGYRVLIVDFDLEAPGMTHFFAKEVRRRPQHVRKDSLDLLLDAKRSLEKTHRLQEALTYPASLTEYVIPLRLPETSGLLQNAIPYRKGRLDLIPATLEPSRTEEAVENTPPIDYLERLGELDLAGLFQPGGPGHRFGDHVRNYFVSSRFEAPGDLLFALRTSVKATYDYVLIDSRTGLNEIAGFSIGTIADALVICCGLNRQNIAGTRYFMKKTGLFNRNKAKPFVVAAGPVPPWQTPEVGGRLHTLRRSLRLVHPTEDLPDQFENIPERLLSPDQLPELIEIPYHPLAAIRETIFVTELTGDPITRAYHRLSRLIRIRLDSTAFEEAEQHVAFFDMSHYPRQEAFRAYCEFAARMLPELRPSLKKTPPIPAFPTACGVSSLPERRSEIRWPDLGRIAVAAAVSSMHMRSAAPFERAWSLLPALDLRDSQTLASCLVYFQTSTRYSPSGESKPWIMTKAVNVDDSQEILSFVCAYMASLKQASYHSGYRLELKKDERDSLTGPAAWSLLLRPVLRWSSRKYSASAGMAGLFRSVENLVSGSLKEDLKLLRFLKEFFQLPTTPKEIFTGKVEFSKRGSSTPVWALDRSAFKPPVGFWPEPLAATALAISEGPDAIQEILAWIHLARLHYGYTWRVLLDWRYFEEVKQHPDFQAFLQQEDEAVAYIEDAIDRGVYPL